MSQSQPQPVTARRPPVLARRLASLRLTLGLILVFSLMVAALLWSDLAPTWLLALPLTLFALNLAAALWVHRGLRRNGAMLVFHLALLALLLLAALGRLTYLKGITEITEGADFAGVLQAVERGPLHWGDLERVELQNLEVRVHYQPGPAQVAAVRAETHNRVRWMSAEGLREAVIGDQYPLVVEGYRIYTTRNFGFAPLFTWHSAQGRAVTGSVHLNQYPSARLDQVQEWTPPGSDARLWIKLDFEDNLLPAERASVLRPPEVHRLVIRYGEQRHELQPGQSLELPGGTLRYEDLRMWMGYRFHYDWTIPWMLSVSLIGVLSLCLHFVQRSRSRPWQRTPAVAKPC